jgi:hypothetical protein
LYRCPDEIRKTWLNLDRTWAVAMIAAGVIAVAW